MEDKEVNFDDAQDDFSVMDDFDSSSEEDYRHEMTMYQSIKENM